ncbi:MAG: ribosome biogenesis GTPase Der [Janthinobacterium lividum]
MNNIIIALVGRPNVGKSTLFNRLSLRKKAIVHDLPGVTRDRKYADAHIGPLEFIIIDTPGLEELQNNELEERMMHQTFEAIEEADLVCLIVDGIEGITPADKFFASIIRKSTKHCILIVNKCEKRNFLAQEFHKLGFGQPVAISAEHSIGMMDLYETISEKISEHNLERSKIADPINTQYVQIVVVGRPNSGKSTFINAILGTERLLTGAEAGITRESIEISWQYKEHQLKLIDTAGLRKKTNVVKSLEKLSTGDTINSIKFANTVILMIDSQTPLEQQDLNIATHVISEGRSLIVVINKWDLVSNKLAFKDELHYKLDSHLSQVKDIPVIFISALNKINLDQVLDESIKMYNLWNKRIPTSKLNQWLAFVTEAHPLPLQKGGRRIRIKYMTQIKTRPPTFKIFSNNPEKIADSYKKYLMNNLRETFKLPGVPIRFYFDKTDNPYVTEK